MSSPAPSSLPHRVGARIRALRMAAGLTQEDLALRMAIAVPNVHRIESGGQNLTLHTLARLAVALDVDVLEFFQDHADASESAPARKPPLRRRQLEAFGWRVLGRNQPTADAVPIFDLRARAGLPAETAIPQVVGHALPPAARRLGTDELFLGRVFGESMRPLIADGAWCLFRQPVVSPALGKVVLVALGDDDGAAWLVKRVAAIEAPARGGLRVRLESSNPAYAPVELTVRSEAELRLVGELVEVLS